MMKREKQSGIFLSGVLIMLLYQVHASSSTNVTSTVQESWDSISNRCGAVSIEKVKQAGNQADVGALYYLGIAYSDGTVVAKDEREGFKWMQLSAAQGRPQAQRRVGWMYENGAGTATNLAEAVKWYDKAAEQGDVWAQDNLGWMYESGTAGEQNYATAAKLYRQAAEQGNAWGENRLGWLLKNGWGGPAKPVEAVEWFQKAAEQGEKDAAENLADIYAGGFYGPTNRFGQGADAQVRSGGVAPNHELAEKWMRQAVDLNSAEGQCSFGDLIYHEFNDKGCQDMTRFPDAGEWYRKSAEQGYAKAQYELAEMYHTGQLGEDQRSNCIPWFLKAAAQGYAEAQAEVSKLRDSYPQSELLKAVNPIDSLKQAADRGDLSAQFDLARRYHAGDGVPKDPSEAFKWMQKAAGHEISPVTLTIDAHYYLGVMYETGEGVTEDFTNAFRLYQEAAVGGNKPEPFVRVGQLYERGEGVPQDDGLAAENYFTAIQFGFFPTSDDTARCLAIENLLGLYFQGRGLPDDKTGVAKQLGEIKQLPITTAKGQLLLGKLYFQGKLVPQDLAEAAAWIRLAKNENFENANDTLNQVESAMSSAQKQNAASRFAELDRTIKQAKTSYQQLASFRRGKVW